MIQGFESYGQIIIWLTLMSIGATLYQINKTLKNGKVTK